MSESHDAVPPCRGTDDTDPYAGAVALAAFNGAILGAAGCAAELCVPDAGGACIAGVGALACLAVWWRHLLAPGDYEHR